LIIIIHSGIFQPGFKVRFTSKMKPFLMRKTLVFLLSVLLYSSVLGQGTLVDFNTIPKSGTILVLSHMDDDVIWMLPWWKITEKFISGAMPSASRYVTVVDQQQAYLDANGYNIDYKNNWIMPWGTITMKEYSDYYWDDMASAQYLKADHLIAYWDDSDLALVRTEVNRIKAKMEQYIADPAVTRIVTHNNWGEYGHQHHKAVNKAMRELAVKYRKDVWMLGCDNGDFEDIDVPNGVTYTMASFNDPTLFTSIRTIYQNNWCWTWPDNIPSGDHKFIKVVEGGSDKSTLLTGESVASSGPAQDEPGAYIFDGIDDFMTMWGNKTTAFTIAMRVRPSVISAMDISKMTEYPGNDTTDRNLYLNANGTVSARIFDGSSRVVTSTTALSANTWAHVAMTGDGSTIKIYINGVLEGTIPAGSAITSYKSPEFVMGQTAMTSAFFSGQLSNVKLYDRALTDSEIAGLSGVRHTIVASAASDGNISPAGPVAVIEGSNQTFSITGNMGFQVADVLVDGVSAGAVSSYTFNNVTGDHTISATFSAGQTYTVEATAGTGGSISPSGSVVVNQGASQVFTITPGTGYRISSVMADNVSAGTVTSYTFSNVTANHTISATFAALTYSITSSAGSGGSISPSGTSTVGYGAGRTFTITPNTGYSVSNVLVDNVSVGAVTSYTFSNVTSSHTISATFAQQSFTITASAGTGGTITPSGSVAATYGSNQGFSITPGTGYNIASVTVDNVSVGAVTSYTFSNISGNHTIAATFVLKTYSLTASSGSGGTVTPSGTTILNHGSGQTYTITPSAGYGVADVLIDNVSVGAVTSYTFSNVTSGHTISASFSRNTYTITATGATGGTITPSGSQTVSWGNSQSYSITADYGYQISDVRVDNVSVGALSSYTFSNVTANHSISATFLKLKYTLTSTAGAGGSINPAGAIMVDHGSSQTYSIVPDTGFGIADVKVDGNSVGTASDYTFNGITGNHTISVTFSVLSYSVTGSAGTGGSISPSGVTPVLYGESRSFSITPDEGYNIADLKVDDISVGALDAYTLDNITANHTVSASFALKTFLITVSAGANGSIAPEGNADADWGSSRSFTISPASGYRISDVKVDNVSVGAVESYEFENIVSDHTISANFELIRLYEISSAAGKGGSITPLGTVSIPEESSQTYEILPESGYRISKVVVDNNNVGEVSMYTFNAIGANHSISAEFTSETAVSVYPSPFTDEFRVKIETPLQDKFDLYVYDVTSRVVYFQKEVDGNNVTTVNLQSSPRGVYIVRLYYNDKVISTVKVIKQ
jgi:hypothetical protein